MQYHAKSERQDVGVATLGREVLAVSMSKAASVHAMTSDQRHARINAGSSGESRKTGVGRVKGRAANI